MLGLQSGLGDLVSDLLDLENKKIIFCLFQILVKTHPFLSSSFLISEVISNPLKGFCSGSFVGEGTIFSCLISSCEGDPLRLRSGDMGGDTLPPRLMLSSENISSC